MPVQSVSPVAPGAETPARNQLGKSDFLKLLMAQLANQDPLQPMDNQAFVAQLAQFASVEQLQAVGERLDTLLVAQASANQMGTASLVGRRVLFRADGVDLPAGGSADFTARLSGPADEVTVAITDASGALVRTLALGPRDGGDQAISWDGRDDRGNSLPAGHYQVIVSATRRDGREVSCSTVAGGTVDGVSFAEGVPMLLVGAARVRLADVVQIERNPNPGA